MIVLSLFNNKTIAKGHVLLFYSQKQKKIASFEYSSCILKIFI